MRFRFRPTGVWGAVLCLGVALGAQQTAPAPAATDAHVQQLLAAARAAAGSASGLPDLKSLEVDFSQRRLVSLPTGPNGGGNRGPANEVSSDVKLQFQFPDNFRMDEAIDLPVGMLGGGDLDLSTGLQNGQGWMTRTGGSFRRPGGPPEAGRAPSPQSAARRQEMMTRRVQATELRDLLLLTMWAPPSSGLQWQYVGEAHAHDGSADVVDVHGPNDFTARLFLDQKTHRLLVMSYRDVIPFSGGGRGSRGPRPGGPEGPGGPGAGGPGAAGPQQANGPRQMPPLQQIELHLSDFSSEHGLMMPHKVVATVHGKPFEQWTIHKVKWNPGFHPSTFEKPSK